MTTQLTPQVEMLISKTLIPLADQRLVDELISLLCRLMDQDGDAVDALEHRLEAEDCARVRPLFNFEHTEFTNSILHIHDIAGRDLIKLTMPITFRLEETNSPDAIIETLDRDRVLKYMRKTWIGEVLNKDLYTIGPLRPTLVDTPDGLPQPADMTLERYERPPQPLPPDRRIGAVFDTCGGQLLIRGEPGTGKTTLLLELAGELITYVEDKPLMPIPIVLLLRRWTDQRLPFVEWLVEELCRTYSVSRRRAEEWVRQDRLILLLDGLDDVPTSDRDVCVTRLNQFLADHGSVRMAICCQVNAYEALTVRPRLNGGSLLIKPLDHEQVDRYLCDPRLRGVHEAVKRSEALRQLATLPLMLNVMCIAYMSQSHIASPEDDTISAWSQQLFDTYVERRFKQQYGPPQRYTREQTVRWLAWLAHCMTSQQQVDFYIDRLEQLQTAADSAALHRDPLSFSETSMRQDWLPTQKLRRIYRGFAGLIFGLAISSVLLCVWSNQLGLVGASLVVLAAGIFFGLLAALLPPTSVAVAQVRIPTVPEAFGPTLQRGVGFGLALLVGLGTLVGGLGNQLLLGFGIGCALALIVGGFYFLAITLARQLAKRWTARPMGAIRRLLVFVSCIYVGGIISGLMLGLLGGFGLGWILGAPLVGLINGPLLGLIIGVIFGTVQGLDVGGQSCVNHYMLRWLLARSGYAPWDYPDFLHYAASLTLLYRIGEGYMFIHHQMMDYFAQHHHEYTHSLTR